MKKIKVAVDDVLDLPYPIHYCRVALVLSGPALKMIASLHATGLWGNTREETMERIICRWLTENVESVVL
mgnify:FL=1